MTRSLRIRQLQVAPATSIAEAFGRPVFADVRPSELPSTGCARCDDEPRKPGHIFCEACHEEWGLSVYPMRSR